jgi:4-carboxymuconolactone decarboxylase
MMRLPPIHPSALDPIQKDLYDDMRAGIATGFNGFRTALDDGSMIGPWNASLHHPAVGKASWQLTQAVNALATLPVNVREVAILVVGGFHKASYEIYAHVAVAERLGMPLPRISALVANVKPADLTHDEAIAFDVAYLLCRGGALPDATWRLAISALGELGAASTSSGSMPLSQPRSTASTCRHRSEIYPRRRRLPQGLLFREIAVPSGIKTLSS